MIISTFVQSVILSNTYSPSFFLSNSPSLISNNYSPSDPYPYSPSIIVYTYSPSIFIPFSPSPLCSLGFTCVH